MQKLSLHVGRAVRLCSALFVSIQLKSKPSPILCAAVLFSALLCRPVQAQELERILPPPFFGTFYLISVPDIPHFFDPYFGRFPVYAWNGGTYLIDDSPTFAGGGMESMAGPAPCDPCPQGDTNTYPTYVGGWTTNAGLKFAPVGRGTNPVPPTSFAAHLLETSPGKAYEIYRTLNVQTPSLWTRVAVGTNGQTNFTLSLTSTNVTFLAASVEDQDLDGLSDAYEHLVIGSTNTLWDTDGDGIPDGWEVAYGLNPTNRFRRHQRRCQRHQQLAEVLGRSGAPASCRTARPEQSPHAAGHFGNHVQSSNGKRVHRDLQFASPAVKT